MPLYLHFINNTTSAVHNANPTTPPITPPIMAPLSTFFFPPVFGTAVAVADPELDFADDLLADDRTMVEGVGVEDTAKIGTVGVKA
jgi:hypothetical protein